VSSHGADLQRDLILEELLSDLAGIPSKRPSMLGMHTPANALDLTGATVLADCATSTEAKLKQHMGFHPAWP